MSKQQDVTLRIFLTFSGFLVLLAGLNYYSYASMKNRVSLFVMIGCLVVLIGWFLAYMLYFRKSGDGS